MKKKVVINWSGHPLPEATWLAPYKVWSPEDPPHFKVDSWESIQLSVRELIDELPKDIQMRIMRADPNVVIVIPQLAAALTILLATLHGIMGIFPRITSPLRGASGYWLPEPVDLQNMRHKCRNMRRME